MDKEFVNVINCKIKDIETNWRHQILDKVMFWDFMKMKLREYIMSYSREKAKIRRAQIKKIEREIRDMETQLLVTPLRVLSDEIAMKKNELEKLYEYSRQGIRVRSRAPWVEEGEENIQYFEQILKSNKRKGVIREIYFAQKVPQSRFAH